jgi:hypothetical protein
MKATRAHLQVDRGPSTEQGSPRGGDAVHGGTDDVRESRHAAEKRTSGACGNPR